MKLSLLKKRFLEVYNVEIKSSIGHKYIPVDFYPLTRLQAFSNRRMRLFNMKGVKCVRCPREGVYLILGRDKCGSFHIDLYTKHFVLMTVDHIIPKSCGGTDKYDNQQPMCTHCNSKKGNKLEQPTLNLCL